MKLPHKREGHPVFPYIRLPATHIVDLNKYGVEGVDRIIVSLPWSYDEDPQKKHPVVYLCDAFWDFELTWGIYNKLLFDKVVPEYTLVGLSYSSDYSMVDTLRKKDLKPPSQGSNYLQRLRNEIIPFVESNYPCDSSARFIAGISIGGLFGLESLFSEPGLFQGAIALSFNPSEYDKWIFDSEKAYFKAHKNLKNSLFCRSPSLSARAFMAVGGEDQSVIVKSAQAFDDLLAKRNYRFFEKQFRIIEGEKHSGVFAEGMNRGLRHLFKPYVDT